ncbi:MAG: hypothetical protein M0R22_12585 [Dehalococcoidia bacterium]|jgi:hypothetical protein|nr:hypothetical protein [Dehalococcoidia bacterium]
MTTRRITQGDIGIYEDPELQGPQRQPVTEACEQAMPGIEVLFRNSMLMLPVVASMAPDSAAYQMFAKLARVASKADVEVLKCYAAFMRAERRMIDSTAYAAEADAAVVRSLEDLETATKKWWRLRRRGVLPPRGYNKAVAVLRAAKDLAGANQKRALEVGAAAHRAVEASAEAFASILRTELWADTAWVDAYERLAAWLGKLEAAVTADVLPVWDAWNVAQLAYHRLRLGHRAVALATARVLARGDTRDMYRGVPVERTVVTAEYDRVVEHERAVLATARSFRGAAFHVFMAQRYRFASAYAACGPGTRDRFAVIVGRQLAKAPLAQLTDSATRDLGSDAGPAPETIDVDDIGPLFALPPDIAPVNPLAETTAQAGAEERTRLDAIARGTPSQKENRPPSDVRSPLAQIAGTSRYSLRRPAHAGAPAPPATGQSYEPAAARRQLGVRELRRL